MLNKPTKREFSPEKFRELRFCITCGKAVKPERLNLLGKCEECAKCNFTNCDECGVILYLGFRKYYSYDIQEDKRDDEMIQYVSKKSVKEFLEVDWKDNKYSNTLCKDCQDNEIKIKDICWVCDNDFYNTMDNYKLNGNMCEICSARY